MQRGWKEWLLIFGIVIIFVLFNIYSINTFLHGDKHSEKYIRNLFIVAGISGIAAIIFGCLVKVETVGAGLAVGGFLVLVYGVLKYWFYAENIARVIILGIALLILMWLGYFFWNREKHHPRKRG